MSVSFQGKQPRILIIRLSAIGDIVIASLLLPAIRENWPNATISWFVEDRFASLLRKNIYLDNLYIWPRLRWKELLTQGRYFVVLRELLQFIQSLRAQQFDWVLDTQGLLKSGLWAWLTKTKNRIGLGSKEGSQWLMNETITRQTDNNQIGTEYIKLAQHLGIENLCYKTGISIDEESKRIAAGMIAHYSLQNGFIALCPFTTRPQKHWFAERWSKLADELQRSFGLNSIILGSSADSREGDKIKNNSAAITASLCGETALLEAAALLTHARLIIGVDTGLTHLGVVLQQPAIALFGSTRPYLDTRSSRARVIYNTHSCSPCRRTPTCNGSYDCMDSISIKQIINTASNLLQVS